MAARAARHRRIRAAPGSGWRLSGRGLAMALVRYRRRTTPRPMARRGGLPRQCGSYPAARRALYRHPTRGSQSLWRQHLPAIGSGTRQCRPTAGNNRRRRLSVDSPGVPLGRYRDSRARRFQGPSQSGCGGRNLFLGEIRPHRGSRRRCRLDPAGPPQQSACLVASEPGQRRFCAARSL